MNDSAHTRILQIEQLAIESWPAAEIVHVDGWRLRATNGVTGRANSVWPNHNEGRLSLEAKLKQVVDFYQQRLLPVRFQMTPVCQPNHLDRLLADQGYRFYSPTLVQTAALTTVLDQVKPLLAQPEFAIEIHDHFHEEWFATYCEAEKVSAETASVRRGIMQRIRASKGFALLRIDGQSAAIGLGVVQDGWLGLFNIETRPEFRRRSAASALLGALATWAQAQAANHAYLQVTEENLPAQRLYEKLGFSSLYRYHYRIK